MSTYVDIHILQTVPPSNLNRDDTGSPKSAVYGGVRRHRVSSQAWKRATRTEFNRHLDTSELGERTKRLATRVADRITAVDGSLKDRADELAAEVLKAAGLSLTKSKTKEGDSAKAEDLTGYLVFASRAQIEALARLAIDSRDAKPSKAQAKAQAKKALTDDASIDVALFGRMIADAPDLNVDACCQVAHAFSVHPAVTEFDYFTAVDDNTPDDTSGAGMIGTVEFVSSTLYRYATVNVDELARSLGSVEAAARATEAFIKAFTVSMPSGKANTFANRTRADLVLAQIRDDQPVNLSEAFETPIATTESRTTVAAKALAEYAVDLDAAYGSKPVAGYYLAAGGAAAEPATSALDELGERTDLTTMTTRIGELVTERVVPE